MRCKYCKEPLSLNGLEDWFIEEMLKHPEEYKDANICNSCLLDFILKRRRL